MKIKEVKEWIKDKNDEDTFILLVDEENLPKQMKDTFILQKFTLNTQEYMDQLFKDFDTVLEAKYQKALKDNPDIKIASSSMRMDTPQFKIMAICAMDNMMKESLHDQ